jgi:hypothetical protein
MPQTLFWSMFIEALTRNPRYVEDAAQADMVFPAEDVAHETNWPRFGAGDAAYCRGQWDAQAHIAYIKQLLAVERPLCIVNMNPFVRLPKTFRERSKTFVADVSLAEWERAMNPRTISMPALPITVGTISTGPRVVLASFRGALSHPSREGIAQLHDGANYICEIVDPKNHVGLVDFQSRSYDQSYVDLMSASLFSFIPRGDALFSYRFLEAISFGCIPIVLSDGWVLPFDRMIDWSSILLRLPERDVGETHAVLGTFTLERVGVMRRALEAVWNETFSTMDGIVEMLLQELEGQYQRL